ncbi:MAG: hypothetical protein RSG77_14965 [Hafnia sp.]
MSSGTTGLNRQHIVLLGVVVVWFLLMCAPSVLFMKAKAKVDKDFLELKTAFEFYTDYKESKNPETLVKLAQSARNSGIARYMEVTLYSRNGDFQLRNKTLLGALDELPDSELLKLLRNTREWYESAERDAEIERVKGFDLTDSLKQQRLLALQVSFSAAETEKLQKCYALLSSEPDRFPFSSFVWRANFGETYSCRE